MTNNHPQPLLEIRRGVYSPSEIVRSKRFELQILLLESNLASAVPTPLRF